ncbi:MAG: hypothetical protein AVDCRST_MAG68-2049 [uncultured Gemmatimonadetes bacterium]|uniref:HTH cro/C1-type domain-containing protein n=1 Tax=uncultured Gemmatimonadota bacterium TaxID=203437 RepID=A0A6J4L7J0_9BACT|nr:MAG: hypothetical protein AVDCRST_MAG68-2049 [uncultured Gemmatimonadota bacterium]
MPQTEVVFYAERNVAPFLSWMDRQGGGDLARAHEGESGAAPRDRAGGRAEAALRARAGEAHIPGGALTMEEQSAGGILRRRYARGDAARTASVERERVNAEVAQMIYDRRVAAGLTQRQLAERVGTRQSVISRLEDADYGGHSLSMLQRVAEALGQRIHVRMTTADTEARR